MDIKSAKQLYTRKKAITLPTLKVNGGDTVFIKFDSAIITKTKNELEKDGTQKTINVANVVNLDTGELMSMVIPKVLDSNLRENYLDESYVGKSFEISKSKEKKGNVGKEYYNFFIYEIDSE